MKVFVLAVFTLSLALSFTALGADQTPLEKIKEDIRSRRIFNPQAQTAEKDRPVITPNGPVSPYNGKSLRVLFLKVDKNNPRSVKIAAFYSPSEKLYWTFVWGGPRSLRTITGPYKLRKVTLKMVKKAIEKLITPEGNYGFYEGQFKAIEEMGKGAIQWLFELFRDESNTPGVRRLSLEALGEMKDNSVIPKLRELIHDEDYQEFQTAMAFTLAQLGDHTFSDRIVEHYKSFIRARAGDPRSQAAGYSALAHAYSRLKKHLKAIECYKNVLKLDPEEAKGTYYNMACSYAKLNQIDEAIKTLEKAVQAGYDDWSWIEMDGDMNPLRSHPKYKKLIRKLKQK